jgi:Saxitoxin biosynthesis operon protein SxtJ
MGHEDLTREQFVEGSSDRSFGLVISAAFLLIGLGPLRHGHAPRWWALAIACVLALVAVSKPSLLAGANRLWMKLGVLLGKVVSPIALGILFYGVFTPLAAVIRLTGKDPLRLKLDRAADSYWITRKPPGPAPDSMTHQF